MMNAHIIAAILIACAALGFAIAAFSMQLTACR